MTVEIEKSSGLQHYEVPPLSEVMTVMDVLDYIYHHLDHTLAYYRHSSCKQVICGRCTVKLDGKPVLACAKEVDVNAARIHIGPCNGTIVRDLVVAR